MGLINLFSKRFFLIKYSIFSRFNTSNCEARNAYNLAPLDICIPFATDNAHLIDEKLPGPLFKIIENSWLILTSFFFKKSSILVRRISLTFTLFGNLYMKKLLLTLSPIVSFLPVQLITRKFLIIVIFIVFFTDINKCFPSLKNPNDFGVITLMYHRFEENKYPSTNIRIKEFIKHIDLIRDKKIEFIDPKNLEKELKTNKSKRKVLLTIDDGFLSFYKEAWPVLKNRKIPFLLFINTREVGSFNYMNWEQIKEISREKFVEIGNHSHSHDYLIDKNPSEIQKDINKSILIFKQQLGSNSNFFSYPFGEFSLKFKEIIKQLGFKYAFGQHSGVADESKDFFELPRFPINEKYGDIKRFELLLNTIPLKYKQITPEEKYINNKTNPPSVTIEFYDNIKNLNLLNCYSNEENLWRKSNIEFLQNYKIKINIDGKFTTERGRINCSLRHETGFWQWLGIQFVVAEK